MQIKSLQFKQSNQSEGNSRKLSILLNANLLFNVVLNRRFNQEKATKALLTLILSKKIIGYISEIQFNTFENLAYKCLSDRAKEFLAELKVDFKICKVTRSHVDRASELTLVSDRFDVALAIALAEEEKIDTFITETTEVISNEYTIPVVTPKEFMLRYSFDENKLRKDAKPPAHSPRDPNEDLKPNILYRINKLRKEPQININGWNVESFDALVTLDKETEAKIFLWNSSQRIGINKNAHGNGPVSALVNAFINAMHEISPERHLPSPIIYHVMLESEEQGADSPVHAKVALETDENEYYTGEFIDTDTVKAVFYAYLEAVSKFINKSGEKTIQLHKKSAEDIISEYNDNTKKIIGVSLSQISLNDKKLDGLCLENAIINGSDLRRSTFSTFESKAEWKNVHISFSNLTNIKLEEADLRQIEIINSDFYQAQLFHADLAGAKISSSHFVKAKMNKINLSNSQINSSNLTGANLDNATLNGANLSRLKLDQVNFKEAKLINAFVGGASLIEAKFMNADLTGTNFQRANLSKAKFSDADFTDAKLEHTNFSYANLSGAVLEKLDLTSVDLTGAKLDNAKLRGSKIKQSQLKNVNIENLNLAEICLINDSDNQNESSDLQSYDSFNWKI